MTETTAFDLSGKVALVTGAGRGLGRAIAVALASAGADTILAARTSEQLDQTAIQIEALGQRATVIEADLSLASGPEEIAQRAAEAVEQVDVVVHAAGTQVRKEAKRLTREEWDHVLAVNLTSPFFLSCLIAKGPLGRPAGSHVLVTSLTSSIRSISHCAST